MNDQSWQLVEHVFNNAIDLPAAERAEYLDKACLNDTVRAEVESLIEAEERSKTFFESRIAAVAHEVVTERKQQEKEKQQRLGDYKLVRAIGTIGDTHIAEGPDKTRVVVRILRGRVEGEALGRLSGERRALALLDHPNVARLIGGGESPTGAPYVVVELVQGDPLDKYCESRGLSVRERVQLFRKVCATVHYAHQHLVIHRNLKPDNILVAGDGELKLLDLGLANLQELAERNQSESAGRMMTPELASPEQIRGEALTTASDVYSLGVILYRLLSGCAPYELASSSVVEIERIVGELEVPPPSAAAEGVRRKELQGDLDAIVLRAMSKAPEDRQSSVAELADELARYLAGGLVGSLERGWGDRARRVLRRHWAAAAAAAAIVAGLAWFAASGTIESRRLASERDAALAARSRAETAVDFLTGMFAVVDPRESRGDAVTAREVLRWGAERVARELPDQPLLQAEALSALSEVNRALGLYPKALQLAETALDKRMSAGEAQAGIAANLNLLGRIERLMGRRQEAEGRFRRALEIDRGAETPDAAAVADDLDGLALVLLDLERYEEAERLAREALELRRTSLGTEHPGVAASLRTLGVILDRESRDAEAEATLREALAMNVRLKGALHPDTARALRELGSLQQRRGELEQAEESFGKALSATLEIYGERHPASADNLRSLAEVLRARGRAGEAREMLKVALDVDLATLGPDHLEAAADMAALGGLEREAGEAGEAEAYLRRAHEIRRVRLGAEDPLVGESLLELGSLLASQGRNDEAASLLREAVRVFDALARPDAAARAKAELDRALPSLVP
jgi:serine/threonine-protein kinase